MKMVKKQNKFVNLIVLAVLVSSLVGSIPLSVKADGWDWYKTQLHQHTAFSDGRMDLGTVAYYADQNGYDALFVTDHERVEGTDVPPATPYGVFSDSNSSFEAFYSPSGTWTIRDLFLTTNPVKSGTYALNLTAQHTAIYRLSSFRTLKRSFTNRGPLWLNFSAYPTFASSSTTNGMGVLIMFSSTTTGKKGFTWDNGTFDLRMPTIGFYLGKCESNATDASVVSRFIKLSSTQNAWNDYSLNVTDYMVKSGLTLRTDDVVWYVYLRIYGSANARTSGVFDDVLLYMKTANTVAQMFSVRNQYIATLSTGTFKVFASVEYSPTPHMNYFVWNFTDASGFTTSDVIGNKADLVNWAHSQGNMIQQNHPIWSTSDIIANNAWGADLIEVSSFNAVNSTTIGTWDAILQKTIIIGTFGADMHDTLTASDLCVKIYASALTETSLLKSLYEGRLFMMVSSFTGNLIFNTETSSEPYPSRYINYIADGDQATLYLNIASGLTNGWKISWVRNGTYFLNETVSGTSYTASKSFAMPNDVNYWRVEVRTDADVLVALSEPIFFKKVADLPTGLYAQVSDFTTATGTNYTNNVQLGITSISYASDILTMTIDGKGTSTTQVYCGTQGQPVAITPVSADGGYDAGTGIQTLVWTHSSQQEFTLDWTPTGGGGGGGGGTTLYRLAVKVLRGSAPVPQALVSVGSDTSATDSEGVASFSLRRGVYTVTVNLGNETQTKQVDLRSNTEVTFALASGWSFLPSIDDGTMRTIVFVGVILLVMLFLIRKKKIK